MCFFFFSSRRRHTRLTCDWSSDVCSSDLAEITTGSPAEAAGLQVGDVITTLGGRALSGIGDLVDALRERAIGDAIEIEAERRGERIRARITLAPRPY